MSKILIISDKSELTDNIENLLNDIGYETRVSDCENTAFAITHEFVPDIALINTSCPNINIATICKKLKLQSQTNDMQIILLTSKDSSTEEVLVGADGYIIKPFNDNILIATVNAHLRIKKLLDILYTNNSELARSLYQLNVLYNTSSQLAGTLDKRKLINIMNEGLEKSLSFGVCSVLLINNPEDAVLIINSMHPISERLEHALKLRSIIGYKTMFGDKKLPFELSIDNVRVEKHFKHQEGEFDLNVLNYDSLFAPISTSDKFFGTVEILRETELTGEDSTCFQTVVKQVSLPLESAILYEEIKKTNIKLEKLEKLKSEFISIVSHELRTPLTAIKNSLDIILGGKSGELTKVMSNFLNMAKRNVDRLSVIINDLLDLSKIEAGKMEFRFKPIEINEPIEFIKTTFETLATQKNIDFKIQTEGDIPSICGDMDRIEQILSNLVSNAIKFTSSGGEIVISAALTTSDDIEKQNLYTNTEYVKISVKDSGIGINEEDIPKVFDKFQQIESSLSREVGGTGLGLPIAKQLIESHMGKIWLESKEGEGSTFSFVIPILNDHNKFILELNNEIQKAKYNHSTLAVLLLENTNDSNLPADFLKKTEEIFEQITDVKSFSDEGKKGIIFPLKDRKVLENARNSLDEYINKNHFEENIEIGACVYPEDGITAEELIEKIQQQTKISENSIKQR